MCLCSQRDAERFSSSSALPQRSFSSLAFSFHSFPLCWIRGQCTFSCVSDTREQPGFEGDPYCSLIFHIYPQLLLELEHLCLFQRQTQALKQIILWFDNNKVSDAPHLFSTHNFMFERVSKKAQHSQAENNVFSQVQL